MVNLGTECGKVIIKVAHRADTPPLTMTCFVPRVCCAPPPPILGGRSLQLSAQEGVGIPSRGVGAPKKKDLHCCFSPQRKTQGTRKQSQPSGTYA